MIKALGVRSMSQVAWRLLQGQAQRGQGEILPGTHQQTSVGGSHVGVGFHWACTWV